MRTKEKYCQEEMKKKNNSLHEDLAPLVLPWPDCKIVIFMLRSQACYNALNSGVANFMAVFEGCEFSCPLIPFSYLSWLFA